MLKWNGRPQGMDILGKQSWLGVLLGGLGIGGLDVVVEDDEAHQRHPHHLKSPITVGFQRTGEEEDGKRRTLQNIPSSTSVIILGAGGAGHNPTNFQPTPR